MISNQVVHIAIALLTLAVMQSGFGQEASTPVKAQKALADLAVPDAPAFKILELDPSSIMRPGNMREVGVVVSNFLTGGFALPRAFGAEIAPVSLLSSLSLSDYQQRPFWYRFRVSIATSSVENGATSLGFGLRFTILDESDPRSDTTLQGELLQIGRGINRLLTECTRVAGDPSSPGFRERLDSCQRAVRIQQGVSIDSAIVVARERSKLRNWNKRVVEVGLAASGVSTDSLAKNLKPAVLAVWVTTAFPFLEEIGQAVLGFNLKVRKDRRNSFNDGEAVFAGRAYAGDNTRKGFIELEIGSEWNRLRFGDRGLRGGFGISLGGEINLFNGIWVDGSVGIVKRGPESASVRSSINLRFATPEQ